MAPESWLVLPVDQLEHQIGQVDLLMAMYPGDDDIEMDGTSKEVLEKLKSSLEEGTLPTPESAPQIYMHLSLPIEEDCDPPEQKILKLELRIPFFTEKEDAGSDALPKVHIRVQQPTWLHRAATTELNAEVSGGTDDLFSALQSIQDSALRVLKESKASETSNENDAEVEGGAKPLVRVWFYFPSISTRSKRDDFIINAPYYKITGFLCAGKPGLLCLEGDSEQIDEYMRFIKTESWGDIPAHHKKVSERYREPNIQTRVFKDMQEITDMVGERRGQRGNRGDMKVIEQWLVDRGVGDAFAKVLM
ncbi:hypothetical protein NLU13_2614 [Sarocladium strictum]|uniref:Small nuclear ribonucleoprotein Prp3 C-terminal domain-containing protein n=1 Tax=Sarocladium strictum TaxID=5046 RepID=A0AA39GLY2_SARSR|nr:hypothetical protein NLU13_2614 [Sarocladium strictum]